MLRQVWLLATALALPAASAADNGVGRFSIEVAGAGAGERCLKLEAGQTLRYRFSASAPVDFNIHYHRGDQVMMPVERNAVRTLDGVYRAESTEEYCLMWQRRESGAVKVTGRIEPRVLRAASQ
jgi:hypothetical protein